MKIIRESRNVHVLKLSGNDSRIAILSDLHWDNPKCDRKTLKKHLDFCVKNNIPIVVNGDFFCLMQGRYDPRRNKKDIRQEHNTHDYLDAVINTAVDWFKPYANNLVLIGYGNHETGIIKNLETDPLQRFVDALNREKNTNIQTGGYGGWLVVQQELSTNKMTSTKIKYFHGSGGGGIVTKGAINLTRALETFEGYDVFTMGHIHENSARNDVRDCLRHTGKAGYTLEQKQIHSMITGTYKEEYEDGAFGWHVERGAPIKPIGGRILQIYTGHKEKRLEKSITSYKFPIS
jgi:predicted phosphodiesterase